MPLQFSVHFAASLISWRIFQLENICCFSLLLTICCVTDYMNLIKICALQEFSHSSGKQIYVHLYIFLTYCVDNNLKKSKTGENDMNF